MMLRKNTVKQIFMVCSKNLSNQRQSMRTAVWLFVHTVAWKPRGIIALRRLCKCVFVGNSVSGESHKARYHSPGEFVTPIE